MLKTTTQQLRTIFLATVLFFGTITLAQPGVIHAAAASVGVVNYQLRIQQHPDMAQAQATYQTIVKQAQDDFNAKSKNMNAQDKQNLFLTMEQGLLQKRQEMLGSIQEKVNAAVKAVADSKGITIVVDKSAVVYGGQDITDDVMKKIMSQ
jgi:outer membrane protein